jgi:hypothetical protein
MGKCFFHGPDCYVSGADDDILLCAPCIEEIKHSVLVVCELCGFAFFLEPEFARETILADNPDKPDASLWLEKMPILLIIGGCSECLLETEAAIGAKVFSGFEIKDGKVIL